MKRGYVINTQMVIESARFDLNGYKVKTTIIKKHGAILRYLRTTDRADLKICSTLFSYPMILALKSIILSVLRYMRVIPGVFGAFWGDFWPFSASLSQKGPKMVVFQKTKKFDFSNFFVQKWVEWPGLGIFE